MSLSCKRKLLVLLGAGSSIPCGMPSIGMIDDKMKEWSREWKSEPAFPNGTGRGIFNDVWEIVESYYRQNPRPHLGLRVNYERILGEMTALASWATPSPFGNALRLAVRDSTPAETFTWPRNRPEPFFYRQLILEQASFLLGKLADYMRERSLSLDVNSPAFLGYRKFFSRLREEYDLGVYNLNYDDVAWRAWPEAFTGFQNRKFDARAVSLRNEWNFIYHLHGSVHYSFCDPPFKHALEWRDDLKGEFETCQAAFPDMASEFKPIIPTTLIAGGHKLDQLLADPPQTFHASLVRHAHEADAVLIVGYGFGDVHVNRALQNRFDLLPFDPRGRPPAVVIEKNDPSVGATSTRQVQDFWGWTMTHTSNTRFQLASPPSNTGPTVAPLLQSGELEQDMSSRTAIWHNGFIEALGAIDKIMAWLRR